MINLARVYDKNKAGSGIRILVDKLWPWGLSKADLKVEKAIAMVPPNLQDTTIFRWSGFSRATSQLCLYQCSFQDISQLLEFV